jgi:hypothetical protein
MFLAVAGARVVGSNRPFTRVAIWREPKNAVAGTNFETSDQLAAQDLVRRTRLC